MSAAVAARQQTVPLFLEGMQFWKELTGECKQRISVVNRATAGHSLGFDALILREEPTFTMVKPGTPSTEVALRLDFEAWGPVIRVTITGDQGTGRKFSIEEFDVPVARDLDGSVIGIFDEGRSFSAHDLARYLLQSFRRCFPNFALPC